MPQLADFSVRVFLPKVIAVTSSTLTRAETVPPTVSVPATFLIKTVQRARTRKTVPGKVAAALLTLVRDQITTRSDQTIEFKLNGTTIKAPLSHNLPIYHAVLPEYSQNFGEVVGLIGASHPQVVVLDIGANIGDSVILGGRHRNVTYVCIEGAAEFLPYLYANTASRSDVKVVPAIVGEQGTVAIISASGGTGVATAGIGTIPVRSLESIAEQSIDHDSSHVLIKIDTDGFDAEILCRSSNYISTKRPDIFFEFDPVLAKRSGTTPTELIDLLVKLEYRSFIAWDNLGTRLFKVDGDQAQQLFSDLDHFCRQSSSLLDAGTVYLDIWAKP
jgi:FkbM family methyltransferase